MSAVLLDTNICSYLLKHDTRADLYARHLEGQQQVLCFVVVAELLEGAELRGWGPANQARLLRYLRALPILPYNIGVCHAWAKLSGLRLPDGSARPVAPNDRWIAACAIHYGLPLISHNRRHFEGLPGLTLISEAP